MEQNSFPEKGKPVQKQNSWVLKGPKKCDTWEVKKAKKELNVLKQNKSKTLT